MTASERLGPSAPGGAIRMLGSRWSNDGSATEEKKNSAGTDETEMLYAMSSFLVQSLPDLADRMKFMTMSKSGNSVRSIYLSDTNVHTDEIIQQGCVGCGGYR